MNKRDIGIILNGVTGRMGRNQHLERSLLAIAREGGIQVSPGEFVIPRPVLVGRNPVKLKKISEEFGVKDWTTSLDEALEKEGCSIYFDSQTTGLRVESVKKAIAAGKHIYCEKPTALCTGDAVELYRLARDAGVKQGVVQDKLWLPGLLKLKSLLDKKALGRILSVRGEFGYWVFEGDTVPCQRPSWNYRKEDGGGIILDMFPHWRYVIDNLFGNIKSVNCIAATHIPVRWDEDQKSYSCTAEDAAYALFELQNGVLVSFNSSWAVRVRRDDLLTIQVDGTGGSAVATLRDCRLQPGEATPRPVWNPDVESPLNYFDNWIKIPEREASENAFKAQWKLYLRHVLMDEPFPWDLLEGAKGVQLAGKGRESWEKRSWIEIPELV
ncbi:MAG: Gfo/Idh/MocA family oxidoreductase [Acidobacteriota bacterium]